MSAREFPKGVKLPFSSPGTAEHGRFKHKMTNHYPITTFCRRCGGEHAVGQVKDGPFAGAWFYKCGRHRFLHFGQQRTEPRFTVVYADGRVEIDSGIRPFIGKTRSTGKSNFAKRLGARG